MASILRSSKFVRYIAGFARNIVVNTPREFDGNLVNSTQCFCGAIQNSFATQASVQHDQNLDRRLRSLDQDVRRSGRISRRDIEDVLEEIRNTKSATSSQSLLVIRCCGNLVPEEMPETRTKLVQEIWNTLKKLNVPMDISHYNALLRVYLENEHKFSPTDFLSELESMGIEPNRVTYQRLIARYCQIGDIEGATRILEFMREKQLPVNENVFNALINGHSQAGDMDSAHGILGVMTQAGLEPSADTYTTLLCGYAQKGDINAINSTIQECEAKEVYLLDKDYLDIVYALAANGHKEHIPDILIKTKKIIGYNQDAINLILRLVNKGDEESAYMVLKSMPRRPLEDGTQQNIGVFFIKQLVKANRPKESILHYCDVLAKEGMFTRGLLLATETALAIANESLAYELLEILQKEGVQIRQHFFWPLLVAKGKEGSENGVIDVLNAMSQFNINPNAETIRDYVLPNISGRSSDIIGKLRKANVSIGSAASSLVYTLLQKGEIQEASIIAARAPAFYSPDQIRRALTSSFFDTKDTKSYISIVRSVYENLDRLENIKPDESLDKTEITGRFILDLTGYNRQFPEVAQEVLEALVNEGLSISSVCAAKVQAKLGEKLTPEISELLSKLSSGELVPVPVVKQPPVYTPANQMNIPQLERLIENLDEKKQDTRGFKRQLFTLYYRAKDVEKMEALLKNLEQYNFVYNAGIYAQLLDLYATHEQLDKAIEMKEKMFGINPDFQLDGIKAVRLAGLFVQNGRFEEAVETLNTITQDNKEGDSNQTFALNNMSWKLLNSLAEKGDATKVEEFFNILHQKKLLEVNNVVLGPLIKVHLINDEIDKALEKFEWCVHQHRATPWKSDLACKLIQTEDAEKLQKLTDLSTAVHGEINSLYDLVFAFVECGRIRQARKILETPGLQSRPARINTVCQRYQKEGLVKPLEDLKDATKDLNHIDRSDIYYQLLLSYIKQDDSDKALGLWTQMQEEDMAPANEFLIELGKFLQGKGIEVPFAMPISNVYLEKKQAVVNKLRRDQQQLSSVPDAKKSITAFRQSLKNDDLDGALDINSRSKENINSTDLSVLLEKLLQKDRVLEANKLALDMLHAHSPPLTRVFRFLLNRLANAGDVEALETIGQKITPDMKKMISFDNRICHANLVSGKAEQYLDKLEIDLDNAKEEELASIGEKFPRGGAVGILERHPELEQKYENIAVKYAKRGLIAPVNVLWSHYFIHGKEAEAENLWQSYLQGAPRIMFQRVVQHARDVKNETLTEKLIDHLKTSKVTEGAIGNAYSCLLDVLVAKEKDEQVIQTFEKAIKDVKIEYINRTAILRVKDVHDKLGKPFNHPIPPKIHTKGNSGNDEHFDE